MLTTQLNYIEKPLVSMVRTLKEKLFIGWFDQWGVTVPLNLNSHIHGFYFKFDIYEQCYDLIFSLTSSHSHIMHPFHKTIFIYYSINTTESKENKCFCMYISRSSYVSKKKPYSRNAYNKEFYPSFYEGHTRKYCMLCDKCIHHQWMRCVFFLHHKMWNLYGKKRLNFKFLNNFIIRSKPTQSLD